MVYTRLSFPPRPADQRHHGVAADRRRNPAPGRPRRPRPPAAPRRRPLPLLRPPVQVRRAVVEEVPCGRVGH